jgi:hypothetical protein
MMTLNERLHASLLPQREQARFTGPLKKGESIDARLADAIRALAKTEGLLCMTQEKFSRAVPQKAVERSTSLTKPDSPPASPRSRIRGGKPHSGARSPPCSARIFSRPGDTLHAARRE